MTEECSVWVHLWHFYNAVTKSMLGKWVLVIITPKLEQGVIIVVATIHYNKRTLLFYLQQWLWNSLVQL